MSNAKLIRAKILKIMDLALKMSPPSGEKVKGTPDVFVYYSPHVRLLDVNVYNNGWKYNHEIDHRFSVLTARENASEKLDEVINYLKNIKGEC